MTGPASTSSLRSSSSMRGYLDRNREDSHQVVVAGLPSSNPVSAKVKTPVQLAAITPPARDIRCNRSSALCVSASLDRRFASELTIIPGTITASADPMSAKEPSTLSSAPDPARTGFPVSETVVHRKRADAALSRLRSARRFAVAKRSGGVVTAPVRHPSKARMTILIIWQI